MSKRDPRLLRRALVYGAVWLVFFTSLLPAFGQFRRTAVFSLLGTEWTGAAALAVFGGLLLIAITLLAVALRDLLRYVAPTDRQR